MNLSLRTDRELLRTESRSTRYLMVSVTAPTAEARASRVPVHVALVLDRSGSMDGERKFALAREAVEQSLAMLRPEDRFTLVVYDTEVDVLSSDVQASAEATRAALRKLAAVGPRGGTDLHAGWVAGVAPLAARLADDVVSRVLLITDGLANAGITEHPALVAQAAEFRRCGVATSTFGVGADFDERLLRDIAHEGGGNFYFIETPAQIRDLLTSELGEALEVTVRGAALELVLPAGCEATPLNHLRHSRSASHEGIRVELGDLVSGQELTTVIRLRFASGTPGSTASANVRVVDRDEGTLHGAESVSWRYAPHADNDEQPRDRVVDREVATLYAARARAEATEANRDGDLARAREIIERTVRRIRSYAGRDAALKSIWRALQDEIGQYAEHVMSAMAIKSSFFVAESAAKGRDSSGKARRG
ncbi:MAG: VWA domain-containing protein [Gemmatimonadaceae bacterium]|nr:VWA domain-containing protein [Gemmatimonadaceae bacterium]